MKDRMTWEQTIELIRLKPEYSELVEKAYLDADLILNVERFRGSEEYLETKKIISKYAPAATSILDIGSGNGISAISFALDAFNVTVSEPDTSNTIGAGAIRMLKDVYNISNLDVYEEVAEKLSLGERKFDVIYMRQAMHHANDLPSFIKNLVGLLKPGGLFLTVRDHVIYNESDKAFFLHNHPLQKFYGGENAYTENEYITAMKSSGLHIIKILKHYDSAINYFPLSQSEFEGNLQKRELEIKQYLINRFGLLGKLHITQALYKKRIGFSRFSFYNERHIPGRMYSFIATK